MSNLEVYRPQMTLAEKLEFCKFFCQSDLLPEVYRNNPANVLLQVEYGEALGIPAVIAIQQVHIIKGKPCAAATLMAALVVAAGHKLTVGGDDTYAKAMLIRKDNPFVFTSTWTAEDTKRAGLDKPSAKGELSNHVKYPREMYRARAIAGVCKMGAQDAICGLSLPEEVDSPSVFVGEVRETASLAEPQSRPEPKKQNKHIKVSEPVKITKVSEPVKITKEPVEAELVEAPPEPDPKLMRKRGLCWKYATHLYKIEAEQFFAGKSLKEADEAQVDEWLSKLQPAYEAACEDEVEY